MKKILLYLYLFFIFIYCGQLNAINTFKYSDNEISQEFCQNLLDEINFPTVPYELKEPFKVFVELQIEDISKIDGKNMDFESFYTLWMDWKDPRVVEVLKNYKYMKIRKHQLGYAIFRLMLFGERKGNYLTLQSKFLIENLKLMTKSNL